MNILVANWTWYPSGGDWTYVNSLSKLYNDKGHTVAPFSMQDEKNYPTQYSKYFVDNINYRVLNKKKSLSNAVRVLRKSIYSFEAKDKLNDLLSSVKVDVAHLQNIHHYLTPSIISVFKKRNIPVIWTLHDYTVLCPENSFVSNGKICENCKTGRYYMCLVNRCKKRSYLASAVAALENYIHSILGIYKHVDYFICPSMFLYNKFIEYGFNREKLIMAYNCFDANPLIIYNSMENITLESYIVYVGRLEKIKGVFTLLKAVKEIPHINLRIIGSGECETELKLYKEENNLNNVLLLGNLRKEEVYKHIAGALFAVCPSEWYENLPYSVVESMLLSKPVVGANIGGIPELVLDRKTGLTFEAGNELDLRNKIQILFQDREIIRQYGQNARSHVAQLVDPEIHYKNLKEVFLKINLHNY